MGRRLADHQGELVRPRVAVSAMFLLYGTILGAWTARIPAIKGQLELSDARLSVALLAFAAGAIIGMQMSGPLVDRFGSATIMIPAVFADGLVLIAPAYAVNLATLALSLLAFGIMHGNLNVAMNVKAVEVQRAWRTSIISSCHAVYSIGGFVGAGIGGIFAAGHLGARPTFLAVAGFVVVVASFTTRWVAMPRQAGYAPSEERRTDPGAPLRGVLFLGVLVFCCLVGEGAAADWSAVYLHDNLGTSASFAASAYAAFSLCMTAGRLVGDRLATRFGPVTLVRGCGAFAAVGLGSCLFVNKPVAGAVGFGCLGLGLSCIAPQVFSAAGNRNPARAGNAIARVAGIGFLGFVIGPPVIGNTAQAIGLPSALGIPAALATFVALAAPALTSRTASANPTAHASIST